MKFFLVHHIPVFVCKLLRSRVPAHNLQRRDLLESFLRGQMWGNALLKLFSTNCRCVKARNHQSQKKSSCFRAFLGDEPALQEILRLRLRLKQMHKQDADDEVTVLSSDTHPKLVESSTASWDFQYLRKIVEIAQLLESSIPWGGTLIELAERLSSSWQANYVSGGTTDVPAEFCQAVGLGFTKVQKIAKVC